MSCFSPVSLGSLLLSSWTLSLRVSHARNIRERSQVPFIATCWNVGMTWKASGLQFWATLSQLWATLGYRGPFFWRYLAFQGLIKALGDRQPSYVYALRCLDGKGAFVRELAEELFLSRKIAITLGFSILVLTK